MSDYQIGKQKDMEQGIDFVPTFKNFPRNQLVKFFGAFDELVCPYLVLHGYSSFADIAGNDIDILVQVSQSIETVNKAVHLGAQRANFRILRHSRYYYTVYIDDQNGHPLVFSLDFIKSASLRGFDYCNEQNLFAERQRQDGIWVPNPGQAYACYFIRCLMKANIDQEKRKQISFLFNEVQIDSLTNLLAAGVPRNIAEVMNNAVLTQKWNNLENHLTGYSAELRHYFKQNGIEKKLRKILEDWINRLDRVVHPCGLSVVMLGQDGAGKSTTIEALENSDEMPFDRILVRGFAPAMHRLVKRGPVSTATPHALPPRSLIASMVKGVYWLLHALLGNVTLRFEKSRNTMVLYDRHFIDVLVDPKRYRYAGPDWLLRLVANVTPTSDLILLLDAPPEVLHRRKPELEFSERRRQSKRYLELASELPNSVIIDASESQDFVIKAVKEAILQKLSERNLRTQNW